MLNTGVIYFITLRNNRISDYSVGISCFLIILIIFGFFFSIFQLDHSSNNLLFRVTFLLKRGASPATLKCYNAKCTRKKYIHYQKRLNQTEHLHASFNPQCCMATDYLCVYLEIIMTKIKLFCHNFLFVCLHSWKNLTWKPLCCIFGI